MSSNEVLWERDLERYSHFEQRDEEDEYEKDEGDDDDESKTSTTQTKTSTSSKKTSVSSTAFITSVSSQSITLSNAITSASSIPSQATTIATTTPIISTVSGFMDEQYYWDFSPSSQHPMILTMHADISIGQVNLSHIDNHNTCKHLRNSARERKCKHYHFQSSSISNCSCRRLLSLTLERVRQNHDQHCSWRRR
jgi:hypothetical protein